MMKTLRYHDLEELKIKAGSGEGPVTIGREDFDALVNGYNTFTPRLDVTCQNELTALKAKIKQIEEILGMKASAGT